MIITVRVKPQSKKNEVIKISEAEYIVKTNAPAHEGRANETVIELLAKYFKIKKSQIRIASGLKYKVKKVHLQK